VSATLLLNSNNHVLPHTHQHNLYVAFCPSIDGVLDALICTT